MRGWAVRGEKAERAVCVLPTKKEAVDRGAELARSAGGKLVIHGKDGEVKRERIYGDAPRVAGKPLPPGRSKVLPGKKILP
jgi:hypothetical protein